jgi:hypothetical protein
MKKLNLLTAYILLSFCLFLSHSSISFAQSGFNITELEQLMNKNGQKEGPDFSSNIASIDENMAYNKTPMGAYLNNWFPQQKATVQIEKAMDQIYHYITKGNLCKKSCSDSFKKTMVVDKDKYLKRLREIAEKAVENEIRNEKFIAFYNGFANEFRLYQDVLKAVKSFEFLNKFKNNYFFRDFAFDDKNTNLQTFLEGWWPAYLEHAKNEGESPFPKREGEVPANSVGLRYFPDSISYAQMYLLSTNVNLLSNTIIPLNSSIFFLVNSSSATGKEKVVDSLIEGMLKPYLAKENGEIDQAKFQKVLANLKDVFQAHMGKSGGQLAQIFVDKSITSKVSYMAWNGGQPFWVLSSTGQVEEAKNPEGKTMFRPVPILYPEEGLSGDRQLFRVNSFMHLFVDDPLKLANKFPALRAIMLRTAAEMLGVTAKSDRAKVFAVQDVSQARLLPIPKYFSNEALTGVKLFTMNEVSPEDVSRYEQDIYEIVRNIMADFLAKATSDADFKKGAFPLKEAFMKFNKPN